jgi:hypothetical protein
MRSINSTFRLAPPLLAAACAALFGACAPGPVQTTYGAPQVNNIYSFDARGLLPNVLLYSSSDPRVSATPPPAYGELQVEFNQPMTGTTLAAHEDRSSAPLKTATFCDPSAANIQLIDVTGSGTIAPGSVIPASICYDPTSDIGGNPHVNVIPGSGLGATGTTSPFTCNTFAAQARSGAAGGDGYFEQGPHQYALKFNSGITSASGQALQLPAAWTGGQYAFTMAPLTVMAAGLQDPVSGYYSWLEKPYPGFMKDLNAAGKRGPNGDVATCSIDTDCQLTQSAGPGSPSGQFGQVCAAGRCAYRQQVATYGGAQSPTPFIIVVTENLNRSAAKVNKGEPVDSTGAPTVTVTRADGSLFPAVINSAESRVITVTPGWVDTTPGATLGTVNSGSWESGTSYVVTVGANLTAADTATTLGAPKSFSFTAGTIDLTALTPPTPDENSTANLVDGTTVVVTYPVALATVTAKLLKGPTVVPTVTPVLDPRSNNQVVTLALPTGAVLDPGTVYTVSITGATSAGGKPVKDYTYNFTTEFFNAVDVTDTSGASINRSFIADPAVLSTGIVVVYTEPAANANGTTVKLYENTPTGTPLPTTVVPATTTNANDSAQITSSSPAKFGQKYVVQSTTALTAVRNSVPLVAEGCQPGTGIDCSDLKAFTTMAFGGAVAVTDTTLGKFTFTFNNPVAAASLSPFLVTSPNPQPGSTDAFLLFRQDPATGQRAAVPVTCAAPNAGTATANTVVTCTAVTPVFQSNAATSNVTYIANVGFPAPGVNSTAATASGAPVVPATFTGGGTAKFITPCFP